MRVFPPGLLRTAAVVRRCLLQSTRTWVQTKYDEYEKGTAHGVAINSDGSLTLAPAFKAPLHLALDRTSGTRPPTPKVMSMLPPDRPRGSTRSRRQGRPASSSRPRSSRCRRWRSRPTAQSTPPPLLTARSTRWCTAALLRDSRLKEQHSTAEIAAAQEGAKPGAGEEKPRAAVAVDTSYSSSVFFDPQTKYIWALALDKSGQLYVGTGDRGEIFRVDPNGNGSLFFKSDEAQIRVLALDNSGNLIVGTDGSGLVYRISPQGEGFVLYSAPKKEITALAIDPQGNIYAAGAGEKKGGGPSSPGLAPPSASRSCAVAPHQPSGRRCIDPGDPADRFAIGCIGDGEPRWLGDLSHLSRRLAPHAVVVEGRPGLCAGFRCLRTAARRNRQQRQDLRDQRPRLHRPGEGQRQPGHGLCARSERWHVRRHQQSWEDFRAWSGGGR